MRVLLWCPEKILEGLYQQKLGRRKARGAGGRDALPGQHLEVSYRVMSSSGKQTQTQQHPEVTVLN